MNYWLVKSEPEAFSWDQLVKDGETIWSGVRNYTARNNLKEMKKGDLVLFYHSVTGKEIVGIAKVSREAYPDPTIDDDRWVATDIQPVKPLKYPVPLTAIKEDARFKDFGLVRQGRLSVMPVEKELYDAILAMSQKL